MAKYQPLIPTGTVPLDQDYRNLRSNFTALNDVFGVDHTTFDNATAQKGYHGTIHFIPRGSTPSDKAGFGQMYNRVTADGYATDTILYFKTGPSVGSGKVLQMTSNITPLQAQNGYTFLPGGFIIQWGVLSVGPGTVTQSGNTYNIDFATDIYSMQLTPLFVHGTPPDTTYSISVGTLSRTSWEFNKVGSNKITGIYWVAIGK